MSTVAVDTPELRKARGAFFTPSEITDFIAAWALRSATDRVLEPSAGDAAFLVAAVERLRALSADPAFVPMVDGVEIHEPSADVGRGRVLESGGEAQIAVSDFFLVEPDAVYDAVIGNPPYIRFQEFTGDARALARSAALRGGVPLSGLASSWAAFTVHSALFLKDGGRLGLVLPAELLSVNYAAPIRRFLLESFARVELVLFDEQVFPEAEADTVLLLAEGYRQGPTEHAVIRQARNARELGSLGIGTEWRPADPAGKWTGSLIGPRVVMTLENLRDEGVLEPLQTWGETTLGIVTGNNSYFCLSPERVAELGLSADEVLRVSPPGSAHLRGLALTDDMLEELGARGRATGLFYPSDQPSRKARNYIKAGTQTGVDQAYKCRVRKVWHRVPIVPPADLLLTYMNADTPRLVANEAGAHHLNSVHGVYLSSERSDIGRELLPLASLNSATLLSAELVGRAYGGGILKVEPKEADGWLMPSIELVSKRAEALLQVRGAVAAALAEGDLATAVGLVDRALLEASDVVPEEVLGMVRAARADLARRRRVRGASGRKDK